MGADGERYKHIVSRDVNNYYDTQVDGTVEFKGAFDPKQYLKELKKGYDMPVVALAVFNYFEYNKPVMETLKEHQDILDFVRLKMLVNNLKLFMTRLLTVRLLQLRVNVMFVFMLLQMV